MIGLNFSSLEEAIDCYGRESLIAISNIRQLIFYTAHGCQPKFIFESENESGKITGWFLKSETRYVYEKWINSSPKED